jgi:hypothetical protein
MKSIKFLIPAFLLMVTLPGGMVTAQNTINDTIAPTSVLPLAHDTSHISSATQIRHPPAKLKLVVRTFEHRKQVFLAAVMMTFIALIITSAQTWNP